MSEELAKLKPDWKKECVWIRFRSAMIFQSRDLLEEEFSLLHLRSQPMDGVYML